MSILKTKCPMYLRDVTFKTETVDGKARRIVQLSFKLEPFTKEMANSLNIASHLFSADSGEPYGDFIAGTYGISVPLQTLDVAPAPDAPYSLELRDVRVAGSIAVRKDKENPVLSANLALTFPYPEAKIFCSWQPTSTTSCSTRSKTSSRGSDSTRWTNPPCARVNSSPPSQKPRRNRRTPSLKGSDHEELR